MGIQATLVLVCGLPASGKTTLAKRIERELPALRLTPDDWMNGLGLNLWNEQKRAHIEALQWQVAQRVLTLGISVVMDFGFWSRLERDRFREEAKAIGVRVELRFLDVPLEELWTRVRQRNMESPPIHRAELERWYRQFEPPSPEELNPGL